MKKLASFIVVAAVISSVAFAHEGHEHATGVVKERMITMTSMGERLLAISKRLRANKDLEKISDDAKSIRDLAATITKQFPPGSTQFPTAAKPAVWQEWETFANNAKKLEAEAENLLKVNASDGVALRAQFRAVAFACDGCHETYRIPKEK